MSRDLFYFYRAKSLTKPYGNYLHSVYNSLNNRAGVKNAKDKGRDIIMVLID